MGALDPVPSQDESNGAYFFLKRSSWSLELVPLQIAWVTSMRAQPKKKSAPSQYPRISQICRGTVLVHGIEGIIPSGNIYAEESECSGIAEGQVPRTV